MRKREQVSEEENTGERRKREQVSEKERTGELVRENR